MTVRQAYRALLWAALAWAIGNCLYVYLVLEGERTYRIESASLVLLALLVPFLSARAAPSRPPETPRTPVPGIIIGAATALWLVTYLPVLDLPFLNDDYGFLALYDGWRDLLRSPQFFRPLFALTFYLLEQIGGGSPVPFRVASLLLHAGSATLVFLLVRRVLTVEASAVAFAVFLLNPLQPGAVLWPSGLQEVLWTFFLLMALWVYTRERILSVPVVAATCGLVTLALLGKETAISFVLLLPAADLVLFRMNRGGVLRGAYGAFGALLAGYLAVRSQFADIDADFFASPSWYFVKEFVTTPYATFALPWNAAVGMPARAAALASASLLALTFHAVAFAGAGRHLVAGAGIMLISTLPLYSFFFVRGDLLASRYLYFAAFGWGLILATMIEAALGGRRRALAAASLGLALAYTLVLQHNVQPGRAAGALVDDLRRGCAPAGPSGTWSRNGGP